MLIPWTSLSPGNNSPPHFLLFGPNLFSFKLPHSQPLRNGSSFHVARGRPAPASCLLLLTWGMESYLGQSWFLKVCFYKGEQLWSYWDVLFLTPPPSSSSLLAHCFHSCMFGKERERQSIHLTSSTQK